MSIPSARLDGRAAGRASQEQIHHHRGVALNTTSLKGSLFRGNSSFKKQTFYYPAIGILDSSFQNNYEPKMCNQFSKFSLNVHWQDEHKASTN